MVEASIMANGLVCWQYRINLSGMECIRQIKSDTLMARNLEEVHQLIDLGYLSADNIACWLIDTRHFTMITGEKRLDDAQRSFNGEHSMCTSVAVPGQ